MAIDAFQTIFAGFAASLAWFVVGGALYMNPLVAKMYKDAENSAALKKWASIPKYIGIQYVGILAQCLLWAIVFALVKPSLPGGGDFLTNGFVFGLILVVVKVFPRFFDMWIQTTYPNRLLAIEFVNGTMGSFVMGVVLAALLHCDKIICSMCYC